MRQRGRIAIWHDDKGFGFIVPDAGGEQLFLHIKAFTQSQRRPVEDDLVTYEVGIDAKGRSLAKKAAFVGARLDFAASFRRKNIPLNIAASFLLALVVAAAIEKLSWAIVAVYGVASVVTFCVYASDKSAAQKGKWRTPESTLHLCELFCGWPGAAAAQTLLRHKSQKVSFQVAFWIIVLLNCSILIWLLFFIQP